MNSQMLSTEELIRLYLNAKRAVIDRGFADEIIWQSSTRHLEVVPTVFLREAAWVVLSAGMSESVVRAVFERLSSAMYGFDPIKLSASQQHARAAALAVFHHHRKIDAVLAIADTISNIDVESLRAALRHEPEEFLRSLPYIGPVTWRHLAKNLGIAVAKPDRHLKRFASVTARSSADSLCEEISQWLGEPIEVVDLVLWRWSVLQNRVVHQ